MDIPLFNYSPVGGHCFLFFFFLQFLTINKAAMNICIQVFVQNKISFLSLVCLGIRLRGGMVVFVQFLKKLPENVINSHQQFLRYPVFLSRNIWYCLVYIVADLRHVQCCLILVLICIFLMTNKFFHMIICHSHILFSDVAIRIFYHFLLLQYYSYS